MRTSRAISRSISWAVASLSLAAMSALPAHATPLADRAAAVDDPRDAYPCEVIEELDTLPPEFLRALFEVGYAEVRGVMAKCQAGQIPSKPPMKLKKPKVPRVTVPASFWAYVNYAHADVSYRSIPLNDPEICTTFINGNILTVSTATAGFVTQDGGVGEVPVTAVLNDVERSDPAGCETPEPSKDGIYPGYFSIRLTSFKEIELGTSLLCGGYFPMPSAPKKCDLLPLSETLTRTIKLDAKQQRDLANPRKGVIRIPLSGGGGGDTDSNDPRTCTSWGDGDPGYRCGWASSWGAVITLVRAEPLDLPIFAR